MMQKFTLTNAFLAISLCRKPDSNLLQNDYYEIYVNNKAEFHGNLKQVSCKLTQIFARLTSVESLRYGCKNPSDEE